jgi:hypothetical protein
MRLPQPQTNKFLIGSIDENRNRVALTNDGSDQRQRRTFWLRRFLKSGRLDLVHARCNHRRLRRTPGGQEDRSVLDAAATSVPLQSSDAATPPR